MYIKRSLGKKREVNVMSVVPHETPRTFVLAKPRFPVLFVFMYITVFR